VAAVIWETHPMTEREPDWCDCPSDWVCCIAKECPRASAIREAKAALHKRTLEILGDPMQPVCTRGERAGMKEE